MDGRYAEVNFNFSACNM